MSLDGSAKTGCGYVTNCSALLTTTQPSDIIIVGCDCWPYGTAFTVTDTAGLTFHARIAQLNIGGNQFIQTWSPWLQLRSRRTSYRCRPL